MAAATPLSRTNMSTLNSSRPNDAGAVTAASVIDYACLFSHDLKRKQKRWQDGRLKFHSFNKRIMVYDERGNFIGDMHWTMDYDFDEGEEFQLARGCVIVQVSECLGRKEQDLSELIDKRYKDKEERQAQAAAAAATKPFRPAPTPHRPPVPIARPTPDTATPRGNQLGRAVLPTVSPFEQRNLQAQGAFQQDSHARPAKRRKPDASPPSKGGYAKSLFGAPLALSAFTSSAPQSSHAAPSQASDASTFDRPLIPRPRPMPSLLRVQPSITSDTPSKPPKAKAVSKSNPIIVPDSSPALDSADETATPAEPRVNSRAAARQNRMKPVRAAPNQSHRRKSPAEEEEESSSSTDAPSEARKVSSRPAAKPTTQLQARAAKNAAKRTPLLSTVGQRTVQPTPRDQHGDLSTSNVPNPFTAAEAQDGAERTSLVSSTKRIRKRGLLIASKKTTTNKRQKNSAAESDHRPVKPTQPARVHEEEAGARGARQRKVSAGLMFDDDDDVIDISDDAASTSSKSLSTKPAEPIPRASISKPATSTVRRPSSLSHMNPEDSQVNHAESSDEDVGIRRRVRARRAISSPVESESDAPVAAESSDRSSSPEAPRPRRSRQQDHLQPQQAMPTRPHLATLRRSVKSKEIIGFYGSANSSREAAALARMRESMLSEEAEEDSTLIPERRRSAEAEREQTRLEQTRAREAQEKEAQEEEARQHQIRVAQAREEARRRQMEREAQQREAEEREALEREAREEAARQKQLREKEAREEERRRREALEREAREREAREREAREREAREKEAREREAREREAREKEAREREAREKEAREKEAREKEAREREAREREIREREAREEEQRQQEIRERKAREQKAREEEERRQQQLREREALEKKVREEEQRKQQIRDQEARERAAREQDAREKAEREREALAKEAREKEAREAEDRERKAREREARLEAREKEAQEREARLEARERENKLKEAREKEAREKEAQADGLRQKEIREKAKLPKFVPPTRPSKLGVAVRAGLSRGVPRAGSGDGDSTTTITAGASNVVNPATRNRKAAQKSDAAGQLPRTVLPVTDTTSAVNRRPNVSEQAQPTTSVNMPGFTRANGGPWSIQAHDLLGIGRPS
ncbi:hypothetical protein ACHAQA_007588 [Verticillium albo-atrum]